MNYVSLNSSLSYSTCHSTAGRQPPYDQTLLSCSMSTHEAPHILSMNTLHLVFGLPLHSFQFSWCPFWYFLGPSIVLHSCYTCLSQFLLSRLYLIPLLRFLFISNCYCVWNVLKTCHHMRENWDFHLYIILENLCGPYFLMILKYMRKLDQQPWKKCTHSRNVVYKKNNYNITDRKENKYQSSKNGKHTDTSPKYDQKK